ncbi:MAG: YtxH domain-containing protein [Thermomicrobiales bacterium]
MGFWKGALLGGIAGAAYGLWTAPQSGAELRETLTNSLEKTLFSLTGMEIWKPEQANPATWSATAANPADWDGDERSPLSQS